MFSKLLRCFQPRIDNSLHENNLSVDNNLRVEDELLSEDELPLEDDSPRAYDLPFKNVVTWDIPDFAERYESAAYGDEWASGEYAVEHPTHGPIRFYFWVSPKLAGFRKSFYIFIRSLDPTTEIEFNLESEVWVETMDGQTSEIEKGVIKRQKGPTTSSVGFTKEELKRFLGHNKIRLCCRFPFEATQLSFLSSTPTAHRWRIENIAERFPNLADDDQFDGLSFSIQGLPDVSCNLLFRPKESTDSGHCGIYLCVSHFGNQPELPIQYDLWLENRNHARICKKAAFDTVSKEHKSLGYSSYSTHDELLELVGVGSLYVCCTIRPAASRKQTIESTLFPPHQEQNFNVAEFSDAEIQVEGRIFKVKKSILSAQSPVFSRMFSGETKENKTGVVEITDLKAEPVELMLRFMYSGQVENLYQCAYDLLSLADRYDVELLTLGKSLHST